MNRLFHLLTQIMVLCALFIYTTTFSYADESLYIQSWTTLTVQKKEQVADALVTEAETLGGYYASRTDYQLCLRIPVANVDKYLQFIGTQGVVSQNTFQQESRSTTIADIQARLKTREELLQKYFSILEQSGSDSVIKVEQEVIRLITEIESLKGQLRKQEYLTTYAEFTIDFRFTDRRAPVADGSSSFSWINSLNVSDVQSAFLYNYDIGSRKSTGYTPTGFATYATNANKTSKDIRATSEDQILYRIRKTKPKQQADITFWAEAVSTRMLQAGYKAYSGESITAETLDSGYIIKCSAANGSEDLTYWIAFFQDGKHLTIIEAIGEASAFEGKTDAILQAMQNTIP